MNNIHKLKVVNAPTKRMEDAHEILSYAKKMVEENELDQILVIVGKEGVYPQAMMANLSEVGVLGFTAFTQGLINNAHTVEMPESDDAPPQEED